MDEGFAGASGYTLKVEGKLLNMITLLTQFIP